MKITLLITALTSLILTTLSASESLSEALDNRQAKQKENASKEPDILEKIAKQTLKTAIEQDELSADVQDMIQEQTHPKVLGLLNEVETLMGEGTKKLEDKNSGGETIAIQTEIIEKMFEAAKQKSQ